MPAPDFSGYAFPVVRVRFAGATNHRPGRWMATYRRDNERTYRASLSYDYAISAGAQNALPAALACFAKALDESNRGLSVFDYVAIPGDLSADSYAFTFIPSYFFGDD